jgi:hypothetical protein
MTELTNEADPMLDRFSGRARNVGFVLLGLCMIGGFIQPDQFFRSYLLGFVFWVGVSVGCLAILMLQHLSGGGWGVVIRRILEAATRTLPLLALLFVPIAFGMRYIYEWADPSVVAGSALLQHKAVYLNKWFFLARAAFYFAVWIAMGALLSRWSLEQDVAGDKRITERMQAVSAPGLLLYGLTVTFASVDWVMSLAPEWFSTIFGILFMGGQGLSALAFAIAVLVLLMRTKPLSDVVRPGHVHDLGKLMLAFVMLWAYFAFSQFLITWAGNLPEEIPWYVSRLTGPWRWIGLMLVVFHFALPFLLLLSRDLKRNARRLAVIAVVVIVMRIVDLYWMIAPNFHEGAFHLSWMDFVAPLGIGGLWLAYFARQLKGRPLLPMRDPQIDAMIAEGHKLVHQTG